ncbi:unnamed protein product [Heligmosomoides polygyrus]|uniref:Uncharacterized protein n=1 Tax=Heligmosomoides polygyrus TaxID=6339 RepID=A0A183GT59_HELPZ|nr:unnamed protein product [Heligmosomoides polygyrus]
MAIVSTFHQDRFWRIRSSRVIYVYWSTRP